MLLEWLLRFIRIPQNEEDLDKAEKEEERGG